MLKCLQMTVLYKSGEKWDDTHEELQGRLDIYIAWARKHCRVFDEDKTKAMILSSSRNMPIQGHSTSTLLRLCIFAISKLNNLLSFTEL